MVLIKRTSLKREMITFYIHDIFTTDVNMQVHNVGRLFPRLSTRRLRAAQCSVGDETSPRQHVLCLPRSLTQHRHRHT